MKKILITGKNSYIGTSVEKWLAEYPDRYQIDTIDMKDASWESLDFSLYDVIFHVAGIAHADTGKVTDEQKQLYYKVNTELTIKTAQKFKNDSLNNKDSRTKQFIFMSSIIVYGEETFANKKRVINNTTQPKPSSYYGDSKLQAELGLIPLENSKFRIAIIRPPMIYGPNSKGNYPQLAKMAVKLPIFPDVKNERSMLFVDNLSEFVKKLIDSGLNGTFFPQNKEYVRTSEMVREISKAHSKKTIFVPRINWFMKFLGTFPGKIGKLTNKAFGNLVYSKELSRSSPISDYQVADFKESIKITERQCR